MLRNRKKLIKSVKHLDAFPKTSEECIETTTTGGTVSLISFGIIIWLTLWECSYYLDTDFIFRFTPDTDQEKLKINVDITIAMPCRFVGADVLDITGQQVLSFGDLKLEDTWFELDPDQRFHFEGVQKINSYLREQFHSVHKLLWKSGYIDLFGRIPARKVFPDYEKDACRISGNINVNKVAGNFHVTAGKTIPLPRGHAHIAIFMDDRDYNFSHRIEKFSFGDPAPGIVHPLEGDEQITDANMMTYQYFITVVPTIVNTYNFNGRTFQYSVSEQWREISHNKGSHGTPGIFFKYDLSALKVEVSEEHEFFLLFLARLCGIVGGVFTCSGLMKRIFSFFLDCFLCRYFQPVKVTPEEKPITFSRLSSSESPSACTTPLLYTADDMVTSESGDASNNYFNKNENAC